jgi:hypothetical protein
MTFPGEDVMKALESLTTLSGAEIEVMEAVAREGLARHEANLKEGAEHSSHALCKRVIEIVGTHRFELLRMGVEL